MNNGNTSLSDELLNKGEEIARTQNREPTAVVEDAVTKYVEKQSWAGFVSRNEQRAKALGLTEDDVPHLVQEVRPENHKKRVSTARHCRY